MFQVLKHWDSNIPPKQVLSNEGWGAAFPPPPHRTPVPGDKHLAACIQSKQCQNIILATAEDKITFFPLICLPFSPLSFLPLPCSLNLESLLVFCMFDMANEDSIGSSEHTAHTQSGKSHQNMGHAPSKASVLSTLTKQ